MYWGGGELQFSFYAAFPSKIAPKMALCCKRCCNFRVGFFW